MKSIKVIEFKEAPIFKVTEYEDDEAVDEYYVFYIPQKDFFICYCEMFVRRLNCKHIRYVKSYLVSKSLNSNSNC